MSEQSQNLPSSHPIEASFFSNSGGKIQSLINSDGVRKPVQGKSVWYSFEFAQPVFLTKVQVHCEGYENWNTFQLLVNHSDGTQNEAKVRVEDGSVSLEHGKLSTGFQFKPDRKLLSNTRITKVTAFGYSLREFHQLEVGVRNYHKRIFEVEKREEAYANLSDTVAKLNEEKKRLDTEIGQSKAQVEQLAADISSGKNSLAEQSSRQEDLKSDIENRRSAKRNLETEISNKRADLDELTRQVRLFPSEITGFVREGNRNIYWYLAIGAPFLVLMAGVVASLFSKAVDLTQLWRVSDDVNVWVVFLTRLPFVIVAVAIVEACGYIVGRLIYEIVRINRQRLEFSKLSIIAKDVTTASANVAEISEDRVFEEETKLKMELLREHMKSYSGSEFEYKGGALVSALVGVAEKFTKKATGES